MAFFANSLISFADLPKDTSTTFYTSSRLEAVLVAVFPNLIRLATAPVIATPLKIFLKELLIDLVAFVVVVFNELSWPDTFLISFYNPLVSAEMRTLISSIVIVYSHHPF
jgi:hypothetical protein